MLPSVDSALDHRRGQNVVRTHVPPFFALLQFNVICDLLQMKIGLQDLNVRGLLGARSDSHLKNTKIVQFVLPVKDRHLSPCKGLWKHPLFS